MFARITFPLLLPGILAAALLSFALSFDDFIITNFNSGAVTTFPKYIYISAARGIPAEANVLASAVFILALVVVVTVTGSRRGVEISATAFCNCCTELWAALNSSWP